MNIYNVGPCELSFNDFDLIDFEFIVYYYETGCYCGSGEAVGFCKTDRLIYVKNLGHCSCYGPMDDGMKSGESYDIKYFLDHKENIHHYDAREEIKTKVEELLREYALRKFNLLMHL